MARSKRVSVAKDTSNAGTGISKAKYDEKLCCLNCGSSNINNFYTTKDPSRSYFGKIPYCKDCVKKFYDKYYKLYNKNQNMAIYYLCRKIDIPYVHTAYLGAIENLNNVNSKIQSGEHALVSAYMKNMSFAEKNGWGFTFDDSQGESEIEGISSFEATTKVKRNLNFNSSSTDNIDVIEYDTEQLVQKWGLFPNEDLAYLESEYLDWEEKLNGITEKSIDIMVKQVCLQCNEIRKDRENNINVDKKLATLQNLLKTSGLIEMQDSGSDERRVGMSISDIEFKRPVKTVNPELDDVDNMRDVIYGFVGALSRTLGKENAYTEKFDEIYGRYSIDIIDDLKKQKEADPEGKLEVGDDNE